MTWRIIPGDCIESMRGMDEASVDAVVCDPPYGLEFMGKDWDRFEKPLTATQRSDHMNRSDSHGPWGRRSRPIMPNDYGHRNERCLKCNKWRISSNRCECDEPEWEYRTRDAAPPAMLAFQEWSREWAIEAKRVLKPGGHLIAAGSSRTFHRLVCAVEDAGFEIRDTITWHFGSGFPKSLNVSEALRRLPACSCDVANEVGAVGAVPPPSTVGAGVRAEARTVPLAGGTADHAGGVRPNVSTDSPDALSNVDGGVEQAGGNDSPVMLGASGVAGAAECDQIGGGVGGVEVGPEALRDQVVGDEPVGGTAVGAGSVAGDYLGGDGGPSASPVLPLAATPSGVSGAGEPLPIGGSHAVAGAVDGDSLSVADGFGAADGAGELHKLKCKACGGVRREAVPEGFGTALKPATEFWTLARKPLTGTVAGNVLAHGTGALNVDGCRVEGPKGDGNWKGKTDRKRGEDFAGFEGGWSDDEPGEQNAGGRWPANVILDPEAAALLDEQSGERPGMAGGGTRGAGFRSEYVNGDRPDSELEPRIYGDTGGASRFFPTFPPDKLCVLCNLPCVESAGNPSPRSEARNGTAPADARDSQPPASEDSEGGSGTSAKSAAASSRTTPPTVTAITSTAPPDAPPKLAEWIVRLARSAESMCDSCATATAQRVARTLQGQTPDSRPGRASISERRLQTLSRSLALTAAGSQSTGITPTTADLKSSFGSALAATASATEATTSESDQTRFRYQSKASRAERNAGLGGFPERVRAITEGHGRGAVNTSKGDGTGIRENKPTANVHPTVKPIALMRWLCRLVTPPGGTVLDPFTGSGTTGAAAVLEGFDFIGCEREEEYVRIAEARIAYWARYEGAEVEAVLRSDDHELRDQGQLDLLGDAA